MTEQLKPSGRFTKKPVTIDAWRIDLDSAQPDWVRTAFGHDVIDWSPDGEGLYVNTLEGCMVGNIGDWLIRGIKEELYACKSEIFDATYSPADEDAQPAQVGHVPEVDCGNKAGQALTDAEIDHITDVQWGAHAKHLHAAYRAYARAIEQAVLAKVALVPMTRESRYDAFMAAEKAAGAEISPWSFDEGIRAAEKFHGIVGKEGGND